MSSDISPLDDTLTPGQWLLGGQMMFVAFGALVLVPLLTGLDPNVAPFTAGAGALVFQARTRGKAAVFPVPHTAGKRARRSSSPTGMVLRM